MERGVAEQVLAVVGEVLRQVRVDELVTQDDRCGQSAGLNDADDRRDEDHRHQGDSRPVLPRPDAGAWDRPHASEGR